MIARDLLADAGAKLAALAAIVVRRLAAGVTDTACRLP